mmetsp:Transcript_882/g.1836  ORF Transcript_882/g.1836 Transcript_882/m.1836 type:complete len:145 (+) Transcript_882:257-691(+)|eukprot:CAMPEP_0183723874 /NCGR_PEP_ID=MMETSP0737-20130205/16644_1 /TAXON_ID=385413 /ORGANISM="Thalassiosira miniscula, Strain CCMP1093" /LENGTH=144 /DNA_ID=CAMNT_0025954287 /DNA_START=140 /DNA_END=574 /DNA_ORIENTATION=-
MNTNSANNGNKNAVAASDASPCHVPAMAQAFLADEDIRELANASQTPSKDQDPFLYFSDRWRRRAYLMDAGGEGQDASFKCSGASNVERKTRISFELHPSVIMEALLLDSMDSNDEEEDLVDDLHLSALFYSVDEEYEEPIITQ